IVDRLARLEPQLERVTEALEADRPLITPAADDPTGYIGLSRIQFLLGRRQEALKTLDDGLKSVPSGNSAGRLALISELEARAEVQRALTEAQNISNSSDSAARVVEARLLTKLGRLSEARVLLEKVVGGQPEK